MQEISNKTMENLKKLEAEHLDFLAEREDRAINNNPHLSIIDGSAVQHLDGKWKNKVTVEVHCPHCDVVVTRATSDLHTFNGCPDCSKELKKSTKKLGALAELTRLRAKIAKMEAEEKAKETAEAGRSS